MCKDLTKILKKVWKLLLGVVTFIYNAIIVPVLRIFFILTLILIVIGIVLSIGTSISTTNKDYSNAIILESSAIAISATLALLCFEYTRSERDPNKNVTKAGRLFFVATIYFIFSTLFITTAIHMQSLYPQYKEILVFVSPLFAVFGILILLFAAVAFAAALLRVWYEFRNIPPSG